MIKRDNEELWQYIKNYIMSLEIAGTKAHQWSARKAQLCVRLYKQFGGGYIGPKEKNNSLSKWSEQQWTTLSGMPSNITGERYLPKKAIENLTPQQYHITTLEKQKAMKQNKQYSKQPIEISNITKKYR